jgi:hypothetical protein
MLAWYKQLTLASTHISWVVYILSCVRVTCKTGFGLDDWIYCTLYTHTVRDYRQYSAIAILHTLQFTVAHALGFSVFTSRILATDFSQTNCNFRSQMKSFFTVKFLSCHYSATANSEDSTQFKSSARKFIYRQAGFSQPDSPLCAAQLNSL